MPTKDPIPKSKLLHVTTRAAWRAWLKANYRSRTEVWLVYSRKGSGKPRLAYNDAVEEALCFGWIDSIVRSIDAERFAQRFSVRKPGSKYSQANLERLRALVRRRRVMRDVLPTIPDLSEAEFKIPADILRAIRANRKAWKHFREFLAGLRPHSDRLHRRRPPQAGGISQAAGALRARDRGEPAVRFRRDRQVLLRRVSHSGPTRV